jgi:AcrR family transcriptional regulator
MRKPTEQRQAEIIQGTLALATRQGVARITTQAIADEVGISHATVFRHFKNRDEIFAAALEWIISRMMEAQKHHFTGTEPADQRLQSLIQTQLGFFSQNKGLPRLLFSDRLHMESRGLKELVRTAMKRFTSRISEIISTGIDEGHFRHDLDAHHSAVYLIALFQGLMLRWSVFDFEFELKDEAEHLWRLYRAHIATD